MDDNHGILQDIDKLIFEAEQLEEFDLKASWNKMKDKLFKRSVPKRVESEDKRDTVKQRSARCYATIVRIKQEFNKPFDKSDKAQVKNGVECKKLINNIFS